MSTLWLTRMCAYIHSDEALISAEHIVQHKVRQQFLHIHKTPPSFQKIRSVSDLLLYEGRCAQIYWKNFRMLLPSWCTFQSRKRVLNDVTNQLLNIGYHHLNTVLTKIISTHSISPTLALFHKAKTEKSKPLVYDLMELFRADLVDREVVRFLRLKKRPIELLTQRDIGMFLSRLNKRLERKVYVKAFKQCHTYRYCMELQVLRFIRAVNHKDIFVPLTFPRRHESRCLTPNTKQGTIHSAVL